MGLNVECFRGLSVTPLQRIHHPKGDIFHALKCADNDFAKFGEAYFTSIKHGEIKGWKQHKKMILNLVVPVGQVGFYFFHEDKTFYLSAGESNYVRITVQPNIWVAFEGVGESMNLILNIASEEHDPNEALSADIEAFPLHA